jgi:hypothetical protein
MEKAIYFDMDGTIANLYGVPNWLEKIEQSDVTPYKEAQVLLNMQGLAHRLNTLQKAGYVIGIISWLSKSGTPEYNEAVAQAKVAWLKQHLGSVKFDEIHITAFGIRKSKVAEIKNGILFDDNPKVRREWIKHNPSGWACSEKDILEILSVLK